jgi:hypothetical protein
MVGPGSPECGVGVGGVGVRGGRGDEIGAALGEVVGVAVAGGSDAAGDEAPTDGTTTPDAEGSVLGVAHAEG